MYYTDRYVYYEKKILMFENLKRNKNSNIFIYNKYIQKSNL